MKRRIQRFITARQSNTITDKINDDLGDEARASLENWQFAWKRAEQLRARGYDVSVPPPYRGRAQLILIGRKAGIGTSEQ
ncbi:MAG: hypothetical protein ACREO5_12095 [Candidatus Binatia bacterium]